MIKVTLSNDILKYITEIDKNRYYVSSVKLSKTVANLDKLLFENGSSLFK